MIFEAPTNIDDRDWIPPAPSKVDKQNRLTASENETDEEDAKFDPTRDNFRYVAEILNIIRPVTHCNVTKIFYFTNLKV